MTFRISETRCLGDPRPTGSIYDDNVTIVTMNADVSPEINVEDATELKLSDYLDKVIVDPKGRWDNVNKKFVADVDGLYFIRYSTSYGRVASSGPDFELVFVRVNVQPNANPLLPQHIVSDDIAYGLPANSIGRSLRASNSAQYLRAGDSFYIACNPGAATPQAFLCNAGYIAGGNVNHELRVTKA